MFPAKGFTLIEILLVVALIGIILSFSSPFYYGLKTKNDLAITSFSIAQATQEAKARAQGMEGDSSWGVYLEQGKITLFKGQSYALRARAEDLIFETAPSIHLSGMSEMVFSKMYGYPYSTGSIRLSDANQYSIQLNLNEKGLLY